jgi:soluble lytic murein transglycosylase-like protein
MREPTSLWTVLFGVVLTELIRPTAELVGQRLAAPLVGGWRGQLARLPPDWQARTQVPAWALPLVLEASQASGVPAPLLAAVARTESAWQPRAVSPAGALGLMQLMPATAAELGVTNPLDPRQSLHGGALYLRRMLDRFNDVTLALAAYNAGPRNVEKHGGVPPFEETQRYVTKLSGLLS